MGNENIERRVNSQANHDVLVNKINNLIQSFERETRASEKITDDHEERIRVLEEYKSAINGKMVGFGFALTTVFSGVSWLISIMHK